MNQRKFIFRELSFGEFRDLIQIWIQNLLYGAIHVGNNKQSTTLTVLIFEESTTAATDCYFPEKSDAACFLTATLCYIQCQNTIQ